MALKASSSSSPSSSSSTKPKQVILSWSGGKDSSLTLHTLLNDPEHHTVVALLVSMATDDDCISVHGVRRKLLEGQLAALHAPIPVFEVQLQPRPSNVKYEDAFFAALSQALNAFPDAEFLAFGDLFLADIRAYREKMLLDWKDNTRSGGGEDRPRIRPLFPLWGQDTRALSQRFLALGFQAYLVCVDTTQLDMKFAGQAYNQALLDELPPSVDPCGENGEFHTFVYDGPIFQKPVPCHVGEVRVKDERFALADVLPSSQLSGC